MSDRGRCSECVDLGVDLDLANQRADDAEDRANLAEADLRMAYEHGAAENYKRIVAETKLDAALNKIKELEDQLARVFLASSVSER